MNPINCTSSELSTYLLELAEDSSLTSCSGIGPCVPSRSESIARPSCGNESRMVASHGSRSSRMCGLLTGDSGEDSSTFSTARSHVSPSRVQLVGEGLPSTYGQNSAELSVSAAPATSWPKTSNESRSSVPPGNSTLMVITLPFAIYPQPTWVPHIEGSAGGSWLPTPTETANCDAPSMREQWPAHRRLQLWTGGLTTPKHIEFLMGWPLGWSDSAPLEMASFQSWKEQHGTYCDPWLMEDDVQVGQRYGRLTVLEMLPGAFKPKRIPPSARCVCDCGTEWVGKRASLISGHTQSCGCHHKEVSRRIAKKTGQANRRHGHANRGRPSTPTYISWQAMIHRCTDPKDVDWNLYGGRGIRVCPQWRTPRKGGTGGFDQFLADMGPRPEGTEIDRKDADGPYEPENCQWLEASQNHRKIRPRRKKGPVETEAQRLKREDEAIFDWAMGGD